MEKMAAPEGRNKSILYTINLYCIPHLQSFDLYLLLHQWKLNANIGSQSKILLGRNLFVDSKLILFGY